MLRKFFAAAKRPSTRAFSTLLQATRPSLHKQSLFCKPSHFKPMPKPLLKTTLATSSARATKVDEIIIYDAGGTLVVPFCSIPETAFDQALEKHNIALSREIIRAPMGARKWEHLLILSKTSEFQAQFLKNKGRLPLKEDLASIYHDFDNIQKNLIKNEATMIQHAVETLQKQKAHGKKIALTTGWDRSTLNVLLEKVKPECNLAALMDIIVTADEVSENSRAAMVSKALEQIDSQGKLRKISFVSDSGRDLDDVKARYPFIKTIGVSDWGTAVGIESEKHLQKIKPEELLQKRQHSYNKLTNSAADLVVRNLSELPGLQLKKEISSPPSLLKPTF